ncbi:hypothetical protein [Gimesia chilikensis]|uniref:Uncharacterized protein n=1 Tax=Gimesia chilikensis TaxID=2605989 RepID=A0A517PLG9_9PLAN|nr:hypothetical protein [Gimesia chilikensis]QDT20218.1 hypothetical protein HG66A1_20030 [Gimesia chilikensis]
MRLEERMYSETDTQQVIEIASHPGWQLDKAHAMYELAFRALEDPSLLSVAWNCIGSELEVMNRQGPPLGQPAATVLVDANQEAVERALVEAMQVWSIEQQRDFFLGIIEKPERYTYLNRLIINFSLAPKVDIDIDGNVTEHL